MELLKLATEWVKAEVFSTRFFIIFGLIFLIGSIGFWQFGKTDLARSYIVPTLVAGILLVIIGSGLLYTNIQRVTQFEKEFTIDTNSFLEAEIARTEATLKEYKTVVFTAIPIIIIIFALLIILINTPIMRAISITTIAMLIVIMLIDGTAHARINTYHNELKELSN